MNAHRILVTLMLTGSIWLAVPVAEASEAPDESTTSAVEVKVVISEEAARFWRDNPVPDDRPRDSAIVNEQEADPVLAGSHSRNLDPAPSILAVAMSICLVLARGAKRRLRTATAVG